MTKKPSKKAEKKNPPVETATKEQELSPEELDNTAGGTYSAFQNLTYASQFNYTAQTFNQFRFRPVFDCW